MLVRIEVLVTEIESLQLLEMLWHVLNPAYNSNGILLIACIHKTCADVFRGIIRQETTGNHRIDLLIVTNLYLTLAFLVLADGDFQFVFTSGHDDGRLASLGVYVALFVVPELAVVDGTILKESYLPVTFIVAPVGREELLPAFLYGLDALNLESPLSVALDEVEYLGVFRQRWEMERHVELAVLRMKMLVELYAVGRSESIALLPYF